MLLPRGYGYATLLRGILQEACARNALRRFLQGVGLIPSAFFVALINALVGVCLYTQRFKVHEAGRRGYATLLGVQAVLFVVLAVLVQASDRVNELFLHFYLGS